MATKTSLLFPSYCLPFHADDNRSRANHKKKKNGLVQPKYPNATKTDDTDLIRRVTNLELLVAQQAIEIKRLQSVAQDLTEAAAAFAKVIEVLRKTPPNPIKPIVASNMTYSPEADIFGCAPRTVLDAADAAGASILSALLAGKHSRMLVDVRDAELTNGQVLVQFIENMIMPVAAGLQNFNCQNRLKICFSTIGQMLEFRQSMTWTAAPGVVSLSTLAFDPVETNDKVIVIVAPAPDQLESLVAMNTLLDSVRIPIVVFNPHMANIRGPAETFEVIYHVRLLSVQYMTSNPHRNVGLALDGQLVNTSDTTSVLDDLSPKDTQGVTRAMVIRAYPQPWHVFVDTSPDTDADFEVAATFAVAPTLDEVHKAIVECLEGSEQEDELVAQQMQQAIEDGQLDRLTEMWRLLENEDDDDEDDGDLWSLYNADSV